MYRTAALDGALVTAEELDPPWHVGTHVGAPTSPNEMKCRNGEPPVQTIGHCELEEPDDGPAADDGVGPEDEPGPGADDAEPFCDVGPPEETGFAEAVADVDAPHDWQKPPVQHPPVKAHWISDVHVTPPAHTPAEHRPLQQSDPKKQPVPFAWQTGAGRHRNSVPESWHESGMGEPQQPPGAVRQLSPNPRHADELELEDEQKLSAAW